MVQGVPEIKKQHIKGNDETQNMIERLRYKIFARLYRSVNPNSYTERTEKQRIYSKEILGLLKESSVQ